MSQKFAPDFGDIRKLMFKKFFVTLVLAHSVKVGQTAYAKIKLDKPNDLKS